MFTPPPSPQPSHVRHPSPPAEHLRPLDFARCDGASLTTSLPSEVSSQGTPPQEGPLSPKEDPYTYVLAQKKLAGRRTRWTVFIVPVVLVLITLTTRFISHPAALDALSPFHRSDDWQGWTAAIKDWRPHKRHDDPAAPMRPRADSAPAPTVPASRPAIPTPFPQPFDTMLSSNFSTVGCQAFIANMTQTPAFRQCRPFSLLVQDSQEFITSQRNISVLNTIIWGTCNTEPSATECEANMKWFVENLQTTCKADLDKRNAIVKDALYGLQSYAVMRKAACQVDPSKNTYCYVQAATSTPSDLYFYQLPLGLTLPKTMTPSCSPCVKLVMDLFVSDGLGPAAVLKKTYGPASDIVNKACGASFVQSYTAPDEPSSASGLRVWMVTTVLGSAIAGALLTL